MLDKEKKDKFEEVMKGDHALIHLDATKEGVKVPGHLAFNKALTLKLSYFFQGETTHDDEKIVSYLKFGANYHECVIPWTAVWGITSDSSENYIWQPSVPKELILQVAKEKVSDFFKKPTSETPEKKTLKVQSGGQDSTNKENKAPTKKRPDFLKRVK